MDDDRSDATPHFGGHALAQERADDQIGFEKAHGGGHRRLINGQFDGHLVTASTQREPCPLTQTVERRAEQEDPHPSPPMAGKAAGMSFAFTFTPSLSTGGWCRPDDDGSARSEALAT